MKVIVCGKDLLEIEKLVKSLGFEVVTKNPDLVISYGGDGTLIHSERHYPGIPKLPMRNSKVCKKCPKHQDKKVLENFLKGNFRLEKYQKLHTKFAGKDLYALNEFAIRNELAIQAIRFKVSESRLLIGDGIVVSTPFGSTGYFKSITGKSFKKGFGLAFNNVTESIKKALYFNENDKVSFLLVRGKAILGYDNNPDIYQVPERTKLEFKISSKVAKIYGYETMRCTNCIVNRG